MGEKLRAEVLVLCQTEFTGRSKELGTGVSCATASALANYDLRLVFLHTSRSPPKKGTGSLCI